MSVPSNVSDTDLAIFQHLANPKRVDFNRAAALPGSRGAAPPPILDPIEIEPDVEAAAAPPTPFRDRHTSSKAAPVQIDVGLFAEEHDAPLAPSGGFGQHRQSRFAEQVSKQLQVNRTGGAGTQFPMVNPQVPLPRQPTPAKHVNFSPAPPPRAAPTPPRMAPRPPSFTRAAPAPPPPLFAAPRGPPVPPDAPFVAYDENHLRRMQADFPPPDDDDLRRIKQRLLIEAEDLGRHYKFPNPPTMDDTVEEIQFKIDHGRSAVEMRQAVGFIRDGIPTVYNLVEMANNKFGPFLPIQGFTDELLEKMDENPQRYNYVLERLYRRYWRKGSMSPVMEFLVVFILPFFIYAGKRKFFGGGGGDADKKARRGHSEGASAVAPEPPRRQYAPEPMNFSAGGVVTQPLPDNNIGPSVRPHPPPSGNYFPPAMMSQQPLPAQVSPVVPNVAQVQAPVPSTGGRRKLRPPSHGTPFPPTQVPLQPVVIQAVPPPQHPQVALPPPVRPNPAPRLVPVAESPPPQQPLPRLPVALPPPVRPQAAAQQPGKGPITIQVPTTPAKPPPEPIHAPQELKLPPLREEPEEDEEEAAEEPARESPPAEEDDYLDKINDRLEADPEFLAEFNRQYAAAKDQAKS